MITATWITTRHIVRQKYPVTMPERVRTRHGNILLRAPDIVRIDGNMYLSARLVRRTNRQIAQSIQKRIDDMARAAFLGTFGKQQPAPATGEGSETK